MKKINVLFISPGDPYYPTSDNYQSKYQHLSTFFSGYILANSYKQNELKISDFVYLSGTSKGKFNKLRYFSFCLRKVLKIKEKSKIDCIITYDPLITGLYGYIFKKILKAKLVVEVNGVYTSAVVWDDESKKIKKLVKKNAVPLLMRFVLSRSNGIKILFFNQMRMFKKTVLNKKYAIFPNYVPLTYFDNISDKNEILFAGFPFYLKGVDILIQSFKKIEKDFPDWSLKILGWYPDKSLLNQAIAGDPQIFHHKPVPSYEMPKHIGQCGIFVLPSRSEGVARVLIESAAARKPRIATGVGGLSTVIENGVDGFLVEPENVAQLAEKMAMLMADENLRKEIGDNAYKRAMSEFSEENYVNNYLHFIQKVVL